MPHELDLEIARRSAALPGVVRAVLLDHGVSAEVIDERMIGWSDGRISVPVGASTGSFSFFERWVPPEVNGSRFGTAEELQTVELYGWNVVERSAERLFLCEGVLECLVALSHGLEAVSATGTGLFFKAREWVPHLETSPNIFLLYRRGNTFERRAHVLSRGALVEKVLEALPGARRVPWPTECGENGGVADFFVRLGRSRDDFERLLDRS